MFITHCVGRQTALLGNEINHELSTFHLQITMMSHCNNGLRKHFLHLYVSNTHGISTDTFETELQVHIIKTDKCQMQAISHNQSICPHGQQEGHPIRPVKKLGVRLLMMTF